MVLGSFLGLPVSGSMTTLPSASFKGLPLLGLMTYSPVSRSSKVVEDVYADARVAKKEGKLVGWSSSKFPCELAEAFGLNVMYPENHVLVPLGHAVADVVAAQHKVGLGHLHLAVGLDGGPAQG